MKNLSRGALGIAALLATTSDNVAVDAAWAGTDSSNFYTTSCATNDDKPKDANNACYDLVFAASSDTTKAYNSCCAYFIEYNTIESSSNVPIYYCMDADQRSTYGNFYTATDGTNYNWGCLDNLRYWSDNAYGLKAATAAVSLAVLSSLY